MGQRSASFCRKESSMTKYLWLRRLNGEPGCLSSHHPAPTFNLTPRLDRFRPLDSCVEILAEGQKSHLCSIPSSLRPWSQFHWLHQYAFHCCNGRLDPLRSTPIAASAPCLHLSTSEGHGLDQLCLIRLQCLTDGRLSILDNRCSLVAARGVVLFLRGKVRYFLRENDSSYSSCAWLVLPFDWFKNDVVSNWNWLRDKRPKLP